MTVVFWILGVLAALIALVILFILFGNIHARLTYEDKAVLDVRILFFHLNGWKLLFGDPEKPKEKKKRILADTVPRQNGKVRGTPRDFLEFLLLVGRVIRETLVMALDRVHIRMNRLEFSCGREDAGDTALLYGSVLQAANALFALLDHFSDFSFDPGKVRITPDFTGGEPEGKLDLYLKLRILDYLKIYTFFYTSYEEGKDGTP